MKTITALEARKQFGAMLDDVAQKGMHILISRINHPMAVLIPYNDYQQTLNQTTRAKRLALVAQKMETVRKQNHKKLKRIDSAQIIREIRNAR